MVASKNHASWGSAHARRFFARPTFLRSSWFSACFEFLVPPSETFSWIRYQSDGGINSNLCWNFNGKVVAAYCLLTWVKNKWSIMRHDDSTRCRPHDWWTGHGHIKCIFIFIDMIWLLGRYNVFTHWWAKTDGAALENWCSVVNFDRSDLITILFYITRPHRWFQDLNSHCLNICCPTIPFVSVCALLVCGFCAHNNIQVQLIVLVSPTKIVHGICVLLHLLWLEWCFSA
jgi:hypothetical protein